MPILTSELKLYKSEIISNTATNGGRMSANEVPDNIKNNIFPDVTEAQRVAGLTDYRKVFYKVADTENGTLNNARAWLQGVTPGASRIVLLAGTQIDTQGGFTGTERLYGPGTLNADVLAGATTLVVDAEAGAAADVIFQDGDLLYIDDGSSNEFATIAVGGVAWAGDQATITLAAGLINGYLAATPTTINSIIEQASVATSFDGWTVTSASGTYDEVTNPPELDNIGTVEQNWNLTFTSATAFTVNGDTLGNVGTGDIASDFIPVNPDFSVPYFTLRAAGFGGTWSAGETIQFATHPAALPLWLKRIIPAGAGSAPSDSTIIAISGESV